MSENADIKPGYVTSARCFKCKKTKNGVYRWGKVKQLNLELMGLVAYCDGCGEAIAIDRYEDPVVFAHGAVNAFAEWIIKQSDKELEYRDLVDKFTRTIGLIKWQ